MHMRLTTVLDAIHVKVLCVDPKGKKNKKEKREYMIWLCINIGLCKISYLFYSKNLIFYYNYYFSLPLSKK